MTREEAINVMQKYTDTDSGISKVVAEAHEMAITALEQEPCEDAISRAELLKVITGEDFKADFPRMSKSLETIIQALPSVQPSQKEQEIKYWIDHYGHITPIVQPSRKGHWLHKEITDGYRVVGQCSECKERKIIDNFCPNCGAKMESEEE